MAIRETPYVGCFQMAITIAMVIENVCMSRCRKAGQVVYGIHKQPSPRFTRFGPIKLRFQSNIQAVQNSSAPCSVFKNP
jgi:hypothetical protein